MGAGDPVPDITPQTLSRAVNEGWRELQPFREKFRETCQESGGAHFGKGDGARRAVNLIAQAVAILVPNLVSDVPEHRVRTPIAELRGEATMLELALDRLWEDTKALEEVKAAVIDAILGPIGIIRLGMRAGTQFVTVDPGQQTPVAQPFCRRISLDDYACDPTARNRRELQWEAIRYRMPRQEAIETGVFGRNPEDYGPGEQPLPDVATREEATEILRSVPALRETSNTQNDVAGIGKPSAGPDKYGLVETIELWDVFVYAGDDIWTVTVPAYHEKQTVAHADKWLLCEKWQGLDTGPIEVIGFGDMPDQVMFKPLIADWRDLHDFCKIVSDKLAREVQNAKVVWPYEGAQEDDMMSVAQAGDSGMVRVTGDPAKIKPIEIVGILGQLQPMLDWAEREWANASGNLPLTGGQGSDATDKTATAAQYLQANASQRIMDQRGRVERLLKAIDRHFGWYLTTDPLVILPLPYRVPGGETTTEYYDAATRRGDFQSFTFDIERYSAVGQDPNVRLKRVGEFLEMTINMVPLFQMGMSFEAWAKLGRQEYGIENLDELFPGIGPGLQAMEHAALGPAQPGMGVPGPSPAMNPQQPNPMAGQTPPAQTGQGQPQMTRPVDVGRGALAVGVGG